MSDTTNNRSKSAIREEPLIAREQYMSFWGFMILDFNLEKTELLVYSVIFSLYKSTYREFTGSRKYLQKWCNAGKTAIDKALASLESKGLIIKEYRNYGEFRKAIYYINTEALPTCKMFELENRNRDNKEKVRQFERRKALGLE